MKIKSYKSYVAPIVSYGSSLWKPSQRDLKIIENVQKKSNSMDIESNSRIQRSIDFHTYPSSVTLS